jgi:hypothetical protein
MTLTTKPINHDLLRCIRELANEPPLEDEAFWREFDRELNSNRLNLRHPTSQDATMSDEPNSHTATKISHFDAWVGTHNPASHLEYGKGWWDYVEIIGRLTHKFAATDVRVIGTYIVHTPPPEEELPMPAVAFVVNGVAFAVKWDFGRCPHWPHEWTVSVQRPAPHSGATLHLFDEHTDARDVTDGFGPDFTFPSYAESPQRFTCVVDDELDVATLIRIFSQPPNTAAR